MSHNATMAMEMLKGALALWIVMDPLGNLPIFVAITKDQTSAQRRELLILAWVVAFVILVAFTFGGNWVLGVFGIRLSDFEIAGGALLFIIAVRMVLQGHLATGDQSTEGIVPIACPLLVGPGAITTTLVFLGVHKVWLTLGAIVLAFAGTLPVLLFTDVLYRLLGRTGSSVAARIMGIIIAALGVLYVRRGVMAAFH